MSHSKVSDDLSVSELNRKKEEAHRRHKRFCEFSEYASQRYGEGWMSRLSMADLDRHDEIAEEINGGLHDP